MKYIQLHTKEQFKEVMKSYNKNWELFMWYEFEGETCYIPEENCFINLERAKKFGTEL